MTESTMDTFDCSSILVIMEYVTVHSDQYIY